MPLIILPRIYIYIRQSSQNNRWKQRKRVMDWRANINDTLYSSVVAVLTVNYLLKLKLGIVTSLPILAHLPAFNAN